MKAQFISKLIVPLFAVPMLTLHALAEDQWKPAPASLLTRWAKDVTPQNALPEYPRPQLVRSQWQSLNGLWDYALASKDSTEAPGSFSDKILVPFPYEASLSGVGKASPANERLWYHRTFSVPAAWQGQRILLHFGAVNWDSNVLVNGKSMGKHQGGYDGFTYDITDALKAGENDLAVGAWNPVRADNPDAQVLGKQRLRPGGIFYTAATGIWQSVWIEPVPKAHIDDLKITPKLGDKSLELTVHADGNATVQVVALDGGKTVASAEGKANSTLSLPINDPHVWTPDDPHLYDLKVTLLEDGKAADSVTSYFAMRSVSLGKDDKGRNRIFLNGKFLFQAGVLDQGYWPDGIYTAPTDEALRYDIEIIKKLGFNLSRKHAKVEPDRWYYWADKLGLLVWQDMPQMFGQGKEDILSDEAKKQFDLEWHREIAGFYNHPSIIVWTTFNEGWGQHDTDRVVAYTKELDPTRLVNNASGWTDKNVGDIHDTHAYPAPKCEEPSETRASVCGEFGGLGMSVDGHMWSKNAWGYQGVYSKAYSLTRKYQELVKMAYGFVESRGMSAFVYTQITDVEVESNGLLTYDRAVIKPDIAIVSAANQGKFLPLPPNPNPDLVPTAQDEEIVWRYTTDKPADNWIETSFDDSSWKKGAALFGNQVNGIRTPWKTSDIWIRREFTLPASIPEKLAILIQHDDDAEIYLNGVLAGSAPGHIGDYKQIPMNSEGRKALKSGTNTIAVHCHQTTGGQSIDVGIVEVK